jgi:hypothetical protein
MVVTDTKSLAYPTTTVCGAMFNSRVFCITVSPRGSSVQRAGFHGMLGYHHHLISLYVLGMMSVGLRSSKAISSCF